MNKPETSSKHETRQPVDVPGVDRQTQLSRLAKVTWLVSVVTIGYGLSLVWQPLVFVWIGGWLFALALVAQGMASKLSKNQDR